MGDFGGVLLVFSTVEGCTDCECVDAPFDAVYYPVVGAAECAFVESADWVHERGGERSALE